MSHELRWNPLLEAWIVVAGHRKRRPWRSGFCPFCPGSPETAGEWDVLALPNRYPALSPEPPRVEEGGKPFFRREAKGVCEVVVETPLHEGDFQDLSIEQVSRYIGLLAERVKDLSARSYIEYVMPFKNKGSLIGVSLTHPHSQIYALPFIPPRVRRELDSARKFKEAYGRNVFEEILEKELEEGVRVIYVNRDFTLLLPFYAMWPYEMHVYTARRFRRLPDLTGDSKLMLSDVIRVATGVYEEMFGSEYAYMMIFHQAPVRGDYPEYRLHVEFYTPHLSRDRIKYAAGIEWGAWVFTYDGVPEERAGELKKAAGKVVDRIEHLGYIP